MKPAPFEYFAPSSVAEVLALLRDYGEEGKVLAGGQSLVPLMNMRLARPKYIIDLNPVQELSYIREHDGGLAIGALTRQRAVERSPLVRQRCPLLFEVMPFIGHTQIRNRGTVGGCLAHADPAAEIPAVVRALDADLVVVGPQGERVIKAEEFFVTYFTTALEPTELLREVRFPPWPSESGWAFMEVSRRHGDFALVGVATRLSLDSRGTCTDARIAFIGVGGTPIRAREAEQKLVGSEPHQGLFEEVAKIASGEVDPESDVHASAEYRRHVAGVLTRRCLKVALERAMSSKEIGPQGG